MEETNLVTVGPNDPVSKLVGTKYTGFPVVDVNNVVVGVISDKDVTRAVKEKGSDAKVRDYMTTPPLTVLGRAHVAEAAGVMLAGRIHRLPVVDKSGKLVGIVSRTDIFRPLLEPRKDLYDYVLKRKDVFTTLE